MFGFSISAQIARRAAPGLVGRARREAELARRGNVKALARTGGGKDARRERAALLKQYNGGRALTGDQKRGLARQRAADRATEGAEKRAESAAKGRAAGDTARASAGERAAESREAQAKRAVTPENAETRRDESRAAAARGMTPAQYRKDQEAAKNGEKSEFQTPEQKRAAARQRAEERKADSRKAAGLGITHEQMRKIEAGEEKYQTPQQKRDAARDRAQERVNESRARVERQKEEARTAAARGLTPAQLRDERETRRAELELAARAAGEVTAKNAGLMALPGGAAVVAGKEAAAGTAAVARDRIERILSKPQARIQSRQKRLQREALERQLGAWEQALNSLTQAA